jgi:hypothetical protein
MDACARRRACSPRDLSAIGSRTSQERLAKHRWHQIIKKEQQLGSKARTISPSVIHRQNHLRRDLPGHGDIGDAGIGGCDRLLAARTVEPELDQRYPLV